jgi:hypothetical protein
MNAPTRVAGFALAIAAVFGLALAVGAWAGPVGEPASAHGSGHDSADGSGRAHAGSGHDSSEAAEVPGGLMVSSDGYTLRLQSAVAQAGRGQEIAFVIDGPRGPVTAYDLRHEKLLHLIAVRRDFSGFQHVHPTLHPDGTWTTALDLTPGQWRVFADFQPEGDEPLTLGTDLTVPGQVSAPAPQPVTRVARVDGYEVTVTGDLVAGEHSMLTLSVSRDGRPVTDLQPYLGAYGHLVALRSGDLAYLHVHPDGEPGDGKTEPGPDVEFGTEVPSPGRYHLYLDFRHGDVVRTAAFTLDARAGR